ncbi:hypothetical protein BH24ACI2_BH24ACI2_10260 [soil metagenome]
MVKAVEALESSQLNSLSLKNNYALFLGNTS